MADLPGASLDAFLRIAHTDRGSLKEEVDATTLVPPIVEGDANVVSDDVAARNVDVINNFFKTQNPPPGILQTTPGRKLVLPTGIIRLKGTIDLFNVNNCLLRGHGANATTLQKIDDGYAIQVAGLYNYIGDLRLDGKSQTARGGILVHGYYKDKETGCVCPNGVTSTCKLNTFRNLFIHGFRIGIRVGKYSTIEDEPRGKEQEREEGDKCHPDIVNNHWQNIYLTHNRYGIVRDGDNIMLDVFENLFSIECDRHHVYLPFGADFICYNGNFGATKENGYAKIFISGGGNILLHRTYSENDAEGQQPPFFKSTHANSLVEMHEVVVRNDAGINNLDIHLQSRRATLINCSVLGTIGLSNTQYIGLNNEVGNYDFQNTTNTNTIILDAAKGLATPTGKFIDWQDARAQLEVTELTLKRVPRGKPIPGTPVVTDGATLNFSSSGTLNSGDGVFYFSPTRENIPHGNISLQIEGSKAGPLGQGHIALKNADGIFQVHIDGKNVLSLDSNGDMSVAGTVALGRDLQVKGAKAAVVATREHGERQLYALESPQSWFEDFGSGQLLNGAATVPIHPIFAQTVNLERPYHVFLTPLGDQPLYVTQKTPTSFTVRAVGDDLCSVAFDYRIVALRKGFEDVRLAPGDGLGE